MANVPTVTAPTVPQSGGPLNINAPAGAFGASVLGAGLERAGATLEQTSNMLSQHAEQFQALNNKAEVDKAFAQNVQDTGQLVDRFKTENQGDLASKNLGVFLKTLETQRAAVGDTMSNPTSRAMFDSDTRRQLAITSFNLSNFASTQLNEYREKQHVAVQNALVDSVVGADGEGFEEAKNKLFANQGEWDRLHGVSPEVGQQNAQLLYSGMVRDVVMGMAGKGNITGAQAFLDAHAKDMDGRTLTQTRMALAPGVIANDAAAAGDAAVAAVVGDGTSATAPASVSGGYVGAIHGREGTGRNPRSTAEGTGQFLEKTWLHVMKTDPQFAGAIAGKTDAQILALRRDPAIADRAIESYGTENAAHLRHQGIINPTAAQVGMAHGFGPGDAVRLIRADSAAPASSVLSHEVIKANPELARQTVGQVREGFNRRFGGARVGGQSTAALTGGALTSADLEGRREAVLADADRRWAASPYAGNATIRNQYEQQALSSLDRLYQAAKGREAQIFSAFGQALEANNIQDQNTLLNSIPNGHNLWNQLPFNYQETLTNGMKGNANEMTPVRQANSDLAMGLFLNRGADPQAFASFDFKDPNLDMPIKLRNAWLLKQDRFIHGRDPQAKEMKAQAYLSNPIVKAIYSGLPTTQAQMTFIGALEGRVDQLQLKEGQKPSQQEIQKAAQDLVQEQVVSPGFMGMGRNVLKQYNYVPPAAAAIINPKLIKKFGRAPTPDEIAYAYQRGQAYWNAGGTLIKGLP